MRTAKIQLPPKLIPVFSGQARYRGAFGGRGSAKTRSFALMTAVRAYIAAKAGISGVILCGREYMNSLEDSSMEEVKQAIKSVDWLDDFFEIGEKFIRTRDRKVSYIFAGLRHNLDSIKSKARILIAWVDEAESVSELAWSKLTPTVRESNSEIWITWNPELDGSATDKRFRKNPPESARIVELNYSDNPWFPDVLEQERLNDLARLDYNNYAWIWEGAYLENSDRQVLAGKYIVREFTPDPNSWDGPYFGADWGFAKDPTALVKCWVFDGCLFIEHEAYRVGVEIDDLPRFFEAVPESDTHVIRADNARPETISHMQRHGFPKLKACEKWKGSVEDGVAHLRGYAQIIIHPRCKNTAKEARLYSYKTDRLTGDILPIIRDENNHAMDAIRYALEPLIKCKNFGILNYYASEARK